MSLVGGLSEQQIMPPSPAISDGFWRGVDFEDPLQASSPFYVSLSRSKEHHGSARGFSKHVEPKADWNLEDLNGELDKLARRSSEPLLPINVSPVPAGAKLFPWRSVQKVKPAGRRSGFRMALDDDSDEDEDSESGDSDWVDDEEATGAQRGKPSPDLKSRSMGVDTGQGRKESTPGREGTAGGTNDGSPAAQAAGQGLQIARGTPDEVALFEADRVRMQQVQERVRQRQLALELALAATRADEVAALEAVRKDEVAWREALWRADKQEQRAIAEARDEYLSAIQREHVQRTQVGERRLKRDAAVEEARRRELAAQAERERQARAKAEAEANAKAQEKALREAERRAAEERERAQKEAAAAAERDRKARQLAEQKAQEEAKQRAAATPGVTQGGAAPQEEQATPGPAPSGGPRARVAEGASRAEAQRLQGVREAEARALPFESNESLAKERKMLTRKVTLHIQQIAATQEQIRRKTTDLLQLLANPGLPQHFLALTLANKLLSQCEAQVQQLPSFAFALAQVLVDVAGQMPWVMDVVIGRLHQVCIYTVPKYYVHTKGDYASEGDYFKLIGYREMDGKLESTDAYVARMSSYVTFFAAIVQTVPTGGRHPFGLQEGWAWCARLLNRLPPNRITAAALEAFLKMAGHRLHREYPRPFIKMLGAIHGEFLAKLRDSNDPDARAVYSKLETYILSHAFQQSPEGREFPLTDASAQIRA